MFRRGDYVIVTVDNKTYIGRIESGCINESDVTVNVKYIPASSIISATVPLSAVKPRTEAIPLNEIDENDN